MSHSLRPYAGILTQTLHSQLSYEQLPMHKTEHWYFMVRVQAIKLHLELLVVFLFYFCCFAWFLSLPETLPLKSVWWIFVFWQDKPAESWSRNIFSVCYCPWDLISITRRWFCTIQCVQSLIKRVSVSCHNLEIHRRVQQTFLHCSWIYPSDYIWPFMSSCKDNTWDMGHVKD